MKVFIRLSLFLLILFPLTVSFAQQKVESARCSNQLIYPNADLDNFESPVIGKVKQIQSQETDLEENKQSDLVTTVNYNEQGKVTDYFLTDSKARVFGKTSYFYNSQNQLIGEVTYNRDGSAALEQIYYYLRGNLLRYITRNPKSKAVIWAMTFTYQPEKNYTESFDYLHNYGFGFYKDARCRMYDVTSFKSDKIITGKIMVDYDDEKNTVEQTVYSPSGKIINKKKSEFKFDGRGNWIQQTKFEPAVEGEKLIYKPVTRINRKIAYFESK